MTGAGGSRCRLVESVSPPHVALDRVPSSGASRYCCTHHRAAHFDVCHHRKPSYLDAWALPCFAKADAGIAYSSWKIQEFERGRIATAGSGEATAETHFMPRVFADVADYLDWERPMQLESTSAGGGCCGGVDCLLGLPRRRACCRRSDGEGNVAR